MLYVFDVMFIVFLEEVSFSKKTYQSDSIVTSLQESLREDVVQEVTKDDV